MINDHKTRREWKTKLTLQINFISSKDAGEFALCITRAVI